MKNNPIDKNRQKFNKSTSALSNWPFRAARKDVSKHPVMKSKEACSNRMVTMFSQQEELIVVGLSNHLQCDKREALRVALHELCLDPKAALDKCYVYAKSTSKEQGHTSRDRKGTLSLPKAEKELAQKTAKQLEITDKELIRLAVITVSLGLNDDSIKLTNTKNVSELKVMRDWSRSNPNKESSIKPLLIAQQKGIEKAEQERDERRRDTEIRNKNIREYLKCNPGLSWEAARIDLEEGLDQHDALEQLISQEVEKESLNKLEEKILRYQLSGWDLTDEEARQAAEIELKEETPLTEEETEQLERELEEMLMEKHEYEKNKPAKSNRKIPHPLKYKGRSMDEQLKDIDERREEIIKAQLRRYRIEGFFDDLL
ncbi:MULTISPECIES: hypothetical protein [unclassified Prochlorococcus]|uniref:hypothetical protein n=1 Tax=unclassified Prochlorococcus TaxID=2627481 RepID=UPI0005338A23|nr:MULTISPECIES: hypothetical protein [unclassified Prochlorococcus]KGG27779.1 hypothetical protein EV13_1898 [Prochlorococcus sp. MIT 0702]KGG29655.1 hypothetical protein EV12_0066 [Prochlorococcus sp. MIT 0701]KGG34344.1 hypothetical protein EV14_1238 [Prochlorococcus sp. MIT 0703]